DRVEVAARAGDEVVAAAAEALLDRRDQPIDVLAQEVLLLRGDRRVRLEEGLEEAHRADLEGARVAHLVVVHLAELEAAAAEVDEERAIAAEGEPRLDGQLDEARLFAAADRLEHD